MVISQIKKLFISFLPLPALGRAAALPVRFSSGGRLTLDSLKTVYDIIQKPVITEAAIEDLQNKKYTFRVAKDANKIEIKNAVEELFKVSVEKVTTINMKSKPKRLGRSEGRTSEWKKAIVKLTPDSKTIEFFDSLM